MPFSILLSITLDTFGLSSSKEASLSIIDAFTNFYSPGMDYAVQEELESMGIQDLIDAYQAAYDRYLAR